MINLKSRKILLFSIVIFLIALTVFFIKINSKNCSNFECSWKDNFDVLYQKYGSGPTIWNNITESEEKYLFKELKNKENILLNSENPLDDTDLVNFLYIIDRSNYTSDGLNILLKRISFETKSSTLEQKNAKFGVFLLLTDSNVSKNIYYLNILGYNQDQMKLEICHGIENTRDDINIEDTISIYNYLYIKRFCGLFFDTNDVILFSDGLESNDVFRREQLINTFPELLE